MKKNVLFPGGISGVVPFASLRTGVLTALALVCLGARADVPFARGALSPTVEVSEEYDSNIFANQFHSSDWHTVLTPGLAFVRNAGLVRIDSHAGVNYQRFERHDEENSTDPFFRFGAQWTQEETNLDAKADMFIRRVSEANVDVNFRSRAEEKGIKGYFGHFPTEKLGYRLKGEVEDRNFLLPGMSDVRIQVVGAEGRIHYSPKLDSFVGVGRRWNDTYHVAPGLPPMDSKDINLSVGVDGEILPKVTGRVAVGWVRRDFQPAIGGRQSGVTFDTSILWRPSEETSIRFLVNRDLDTTPIDQSVMRQVTGVEIHRTFREKLNLNLSLSHALSNYIGVGINRHDKTEAIQFGADYRLTKYVRAAVNVGYADTESNVALSDYNRFVGGANFAVSF